MDPSPASGDVACAECHWAIRSAHVCRRMPPGPAVPGSVIGATSAAVVHQVPGLSSPRDDRPIVVVEADRPARTKGVNVVRSVYPLPCQTWNTTRVATPAATQDLIERLPSRAVSGRRLLLRLLADRTSGLGHRSRLEQNVARWLDESGLRGWRRNHPVPVGRTPASVRPRRRGPDHGAGHQDPHVACDACRWATRSARVRPTRRRPERPHTMKTPPFGRRV